MKTKMYEQSLKNTKIKIFSITSVLTGSIRTKKRVYLERDSAVATFWAYYLSVTGKEVTQINTSTIQRNAIYTVAYNSEIEEGLYIEDTYSNIIYLIKFIDRKEGIKSDLKLSALESKEADGVTA